MPDTRQPQTTEQRIQAVRAYLMDLQDRVCEALAEREGRPFHEDLLPRGAGLSRPRVLEGETIERCGVNFSHTAGARLPPAATERRPELAGGSFQAVSMSWIVHPTNPYAPTCHANYRFFEATPAPEAGGVEPVWWFGGGFDLTPYYGFDEDCVHWHEHARAALCPARAPGALCALQEGVRRVLPADAPRRAARHRRHVLRRPERTRLRDRLRVRSGPWRALSRGLHPDRRAPQGHRLRRA